MAVGVDPLHRLEARVAGEAHHEVAALVHGAVLGRDGGQLDPVAQPREALVVALLDLGADGGQGILGRAPARQGEGGRRGGGGA
jgi:hypothetical protein